MSKKYSKGDKIQIKIKGRFRFGKIKNNKGQYVDIILDGEDIIRKDIPIEEVEYIKTY